MGEIVKKGAGFHCPHCGTAYHVRTDTLPFDPENNTAKCDDCGGVMATWHTKVRPIFTKRGKLSPPAS